MSGFKTRVKNSLLKMRIHKAFSFLTRPALLISNTLKLSKWISEYVNDSNKKVTGLATREEHYAHINNTEFKDEQITYLEFGVFKGSSIKWWVNNNQHPQSTFTGFDTFEGLPEKWLSYTEGAFYSPIPVIDDERVKFIKGLFQDTLNDHIRSSDLSTRLLIHLDADLFSSTLFVLTTLAPFLKKGDIIMFDEFNVPNDEFSALEIFCRSYYVKYELLTATRNFFQIGIRIV